MQLPLVRKRLAQNIKGAGICKKMVLSSSQGGGEEEARFLYLLKPIRDLSVNWSIDIAVELEDYLEELANVTISFDGGETKMNFAEAALLIQGSACVYSRKVEYLYDLAKHMLGLVGNKTRKNAEGKGAGDATVMEPDTQEQFLTLDDIPEHKTLVMKASAENNHLSVVPMTPIDLVKRVDLDRSDIPLLSRKGEVLGSRKDFKINVCCQHPLSGTLLLDLAHLSLLEASFSARPCSTPAPPTGPGPIDQGEPPGLDMETGDSEVPCDILLSVDGDDDNGACGMEEAAEVTQAQSPQKRALRWRDARRSVRPAAKPAMTNPLIPLNPFDEGASKDRPKRIGRSYRLPPGIDSQATRKRKRAPATEEIKPLSSIEDFCKNMYGRTIPSTVKKTPTIPGLEQLFLEVYKKQQAIRKALQRLASLNPVTRLEEELLVEEDVAAPALVDGGDEEDDLDPVTSGDIDLDIDPMDPEILAGNFADLAANEENYSSYEQLVRKYVDGYLASAKNYAQITELSRRVSEWEQKIIPKLQEEEEHGAFDIHLYGSQIISGFSNRKTPDETESEVESPEVPFKDLVTDKPAFQVCRLFLATLQLANNHNVEIGSEGSLREGMDTMKVKLLSRRRHHEELEGYRAPTVSNQ